MQIDERNYGERGKNKLYGFLPNCQLQGRLNDNAETSLLVSTQTTSNGLCNIGRKY